jgi:hypothetical protein
MDAGHVVDAAEGCRDAGGATLFGRQDPPLGRTPRGPSASKARPRIAARRHRTEPVLPRRTIVCTRRPSWSVGLRTLADSARPASRHRA